MSVSEVAGGIYCVGAAVYWCRAILTSGGWRAHPRYSVGRVDGCLWAALVAPLWPVWVFVPLLVSLAQRLFPPPRHAPLPRAILAHIPHDEHERCRRAWASLVTPERRAFVIAQRDMSPEYARWLREVARSAQPPSV